LEGVIQREVQSARRPVGLPKFCRQSRRRHLLVVRLVVVIDYRALIALQRVALLSNEFAPHLQEGGGCLEGGLRGRPIGSVGLEQRQRQDRVRDNGKGIMESERSRCIAILELFDPEASPPKEPALSPIGIARPRKRNPKPWLASHAVCPCLLAVAGRKATLESSLEHPLAFAWSTLAQSRRRKLAIAPVSMQYTDTNLPALPMQSFSPKARAITRSRSCCWREVAR
jgi:hypothetical protein